MSNLIIAKAEVDDLFPNYGRDEEYNDDDFPDDCIDSGLSDDDLLDETLADDTTESVKEDEAVYVDFDALRASIRAGIKEREERMKILEANKKRERDKEKAEDDKVDKTDIESMRKKIKEIDGKEKYTEIYM